MKKIIGEIWVYIVFTLVLIGFVGLSLELFKDNGLAERALGVVWDAEVRSPLLATPILGGTLLLLSIFLRGGLNLGKGHSFADLLLYIMMGSGAYYSYKWWIS